MVHEIVLFRFRPDADAAAVDAVMQATDDFLRGVPGFVERRTLFDDATRTWIDLVEWRSMEEAHAAAGKFAECHAARAFEAIGDPSFLHVFHGRVVRRFAASAEPVDTAASLAGGVRAA